MKPVSWYKSLSSSKERRQEGCFLIEGKKAVEQMLAFHRDSVVELLYTEETVSFYTHTDVNVRIISAQNMKSICTSRTPQDIAAVLQIPADTYTSYLPGKKGKNLLLLERVQDPGNVGSLIRTAAALGYNGVIMSDQCADPFSPKAVQSTAGSLLSVWIRRSGGYLDMAAQLKNDGYVLIAADLSGKESLNFNFKNTGPHILALGNEGAGLSGQALTLCDRTVRVDIVESGAESLNVAACGAILMFTCSRKLESHLSIREKG
ncbi:MAG: RNA methyltransferase [Chitinispirillales bacterium]|jgi:TrmH family RNA methyltransferase|nr:RNA methyltransferase [Chitinispirillales bacterium]